MSRSAVIQREPVDVLELLSCLIRAGEQLKRDDLLLGLVGDPLQLREQRTDLICRLCPAKFAAGNLRGLHHDLGHDALVHDRLLLVGGRHQARDKAAAEMLAGDHAGEQNDAKADRQAELRPNSDFEGKFAA